MTEGELEETWGGKGGESGRRGMLHVYTGGGKGKTTASLGLALRAWGHGRRIHIVQFMKGKIDYGELLSALKMEGVTLEQFGRPDFIDPEHPDPEDVRLAQEGLRRARELLADPDVDLLVLDEANLAASWGLIDRRELGDALRGRRPGLEVVLTGREAPEEFIEMADYVTEMKEIKHPFQKGTQARKGVEF